MDSDNMDAEIEKISAIQRSQMDMDRLLYNLHKASERWDWMQSEAGAYSNTGVYKTAGVLPVKYKDAIRLRNARLCFEARQDSFKNAGLA